MARSVSTTTAIIHIAVILGCFSAAWASEPGEPLDCSDWAATVQGFSCEPITWFGGLEYFYLLGCVGTLCFAGWTIVTFIGRRRGLSKT